MAELINSVQGAEVQDVAEPVTDNDSDIDIDTNDMDEPYEFADDETDESQSEEEGSDGKESAATLNKSAVQEPDRNAIYADMRRKAESEAKIKATAEAQKLAQVEIDKAFAAMGLKDPYSGKLISTKAEYDAYKIRHESETVSKELGKAGISRETVDALIKSSPAMKEAEEAAAAYKAATQKTQETTARVRFDEQLKKISALDPTIKTGEDLANHPSYETVKGFVRNNGLSIEEAFKLANMDKLTSKQTAAATQTAINKVTSKEHLTSATARGQGGIPVPKGVMKQYMDLAGMTESEARAHYQKHIKQTSKGK